MGYPMTWSRVWRRNDLGVDDGEPLYAHRSYPAEAWSLIGDLRRFATDARDGAHIAQYARAAGITEAQARAVVAVIFDETHGANLPVDEPDVGMDWLAKYERLRQYAAEMYQRAPSGCYGEAAWAALVRLLKAGELDALEASDATDRDGVGPDTGGIAKDRLRPDRDGRSGDRASGTPDRRPGG